ncbi:MAG: YihA family ribosome biogenesis GTP-binding protein [Bacteroidales bacterium]|nr:YihA family ribosome biogenesis GTP-binding protein [Bacteroidales bacterium]
MQVKSAVFVVSNSDSRRCPQSQLPEYAFIGRSNVGKSSLINMLTNNRNLAKTSVKPGKTQLINHFLINGQWHLVDLPGYGYARSSKTTRASWSRMTADYFLHREQLVNTFVLIDSRIPPQAIDLDFVNFLGVNGLPFALVFTKVDKSKQREVAHNVGSFKQALQETWETLPPIFLTSAVTRYGREALLDYIDNINHSLAEAAGKTS